MEKKGEDTDEISDSDQVVFRAGRRCSVSAEPFDPSKDSQKAIKVVPKTSEQKDRIQQRISQIFLFQGLDDSQMNALINAMEPKTVKAGDIVIKQGDEGDYFYVIDHGLYEAYITDKSGTNKVKTYEEIGSFGELSLMYNEPRAATIKAVTDGFLWSVNRKTFQQLVLKSAYEKRNRFEEMLEMVPELKPLNKNDIVKVCDALEPKTFKKGQIIFRQGDEGDGLYFVEKGRVSILEGKNVNESTEPLAVLYPGSYFGELALLTSEPRSKTARAEENSQLAFLNKEAFERLMGPCLELFEKRSESYDRNSRK